MDYAAKSVREDSDPSECLVRSKMYKVVIIQNITDAQNNFKSNMNVR